MSDVHGGEPLPNGPDPATYLPPADGWVCYHCGVRFTDPWMARNHFGRTPTATPLCLLRVREGEASHLQRIRDLRAEVQSANELGEETLAENTSLRAQLVAAQAQVAMMRAEAQLQINRAAGEWNEVHKCARCRGCHGIGDREGNITHKEGCRFILALSAPPSAVERVIEAEGEPPDWDDLRGRAPDATGELSSEDFVRRLRNEWR